MNDYAGIIESRTTAIMASIVGVSIISHGVYLTVTERTSNGGFDDSLRLRSGFLLKRNWVSVSTKSK